jgi:WD40 repeat protein
VRTLPGPGDDSISLAFAPDGTPAAGTLEGTVEMWDPATGKRLAPPLLADTQQVTGLAFDPSGRRFALTGYQDGTIELWFTAGLEQEGPRLLSDPGATSTAAFGPGGDDLLVVDDRGGAFTWPMSLSAWGQRACSLAGRSLTRTEWAQLVGGPRYTAVCPVGA